MTTIADVIALAAQRQRDLDESDADFAARLGVTRQAWQQIRTGDNGAGLPVLRGLVTAFPELSSAILAYLLTPDESALASSGSTVARGRRNGR